jgi:hypothetical protein
MAYKIPPPMILPKSILYKKFVRMYYYKNEIYANIIDVFRVFTNKYKWKLDEQIESLSDSSCYKFKHHGRIANHESLEKVFKSAFPELNVSIINKIFSDTTISISTTPSIISSIYLPLSLPNVSSISLPLRPSDIMTNAKINAMTKTKVIARTNQVKCHNQMIYSNLNYKNSEFPVRMINLNDVLYACVSDIFCCHGEKWRATTWLKKKEHPVYNKCIKAPITHLIMANIDVMKEIINVLDQLKPNAARTQHLLNNIHDVYESFTSLKVSSMMINPVDELNVPCVDVPCIEDMCAMLSEIEDIEDIEDISDYNMITELTNEEAIAELSYKSTSTSTSPLTISAIQSQSQTQTQTQSSFKMVDNLIIEDTVQPESEEETEPGLNVSVSVSVSVSVVINESEDDEYVETYNESFIQASIDNARAYAMNIIENAKIYKNVLTSASTTDIDKSIAFTSYTVTTTDNVEDYINMVNNNNKIYFKKITK